MKLGLVIETKGMMESSAPPVTGVKDVYSPQQTGLSGRWITLAAV